MLTVMLLLSLAGAAAILARRQRIRSRSARLTAVRAEALAASRERHPSTRARTASTGRVTWPPVPADLTDAERIAWSGICVGLITDTIADSDPADDENWAEILRIFPDHASGGEQ